MAVGIFVVAIVGADVTGAEVTGGLPCCEKTEIKMKKDG
jgi:hypothetical protein